jgi:outer membrane protein OmpA-like peptidoglycan-associated protein
MICDALRCNLRFQIILMRLLFIFLLLFVITSAKAQLLKIENNQLVLDNPVTFKTGTNELTDEAKAALQQVKDFLVAKDYVTTMRIEGHSDNSGNEHENQTRTEQKALAVCRWLVTNGIDCKRLTPVGFGSTKPIESNDTPMGKAANRRIVFAIAALKGKLVGGMPADGGGVIAGDACKE